MVWKKRIKDKDIQMAKTQMERLMKERFKPSMSSSIGEFFENAMIFLVVCLAIIFRPINLIIGGIVTIIILLI